MNGMGGLSHKTDMARKGQARVLSPNELHQLWEELAQPHRIITQLCYYTASRINEIVSLKAEDIQRDRISIRVSKRKQDVTKTVAIAKSLRPLLAAVELPDKDYLFPAAKWTKAPVKHYRIDRSRPATATARNHFAVVAELPPRQHISTAAVNRAIAIATDRLGFEGISSHSFRRSMATHLYNDGVPLRTIMAITGHQSLASLTYYLALDEQAAGEVLASR